MTFSKDVHYWTQLRSALTEGHWAAQYPAKTPSSKPISWSELLRKFNKHCKGFEDIAEIASQTQALALLLDAKFSEEDQVEDTPYGALALGDECTLQCERKDEASVGYESLRQLQCSNFDSLNFALAYYAYALGHPIQCLSYSSKIPDLTDIQSHIPVPASIRSTLSSLAPSSATGTSSTSWATSAISDVSASIPEIKDGRAWSMVEIIRTLCLQGMVHEKLSPSDLKIALMSYSKALPLLTIIESEILSVSPSAVPPISTSGVGKIDFHSFTRFRELWRWVERLIWRAIVLSSRLCDINDDTQEDSVWTWFRHYTACSTHWPASFRCRHRSVISVLHLHALVLRAKSGSIAAFPTLQPPQHYDHERRPPAWVHVARSVVQEYRAILTVNTRFPRAGERNVKVENFVDLCVAVWEAAGEVGDYSGWVIDILWWATRLTFNSHRIFRHMTRLLYVSGDTELAKRTLRLYVQVVGKAHLAGGGSSEADSDSCWVETLVQGARMLCRFAMTAQGLEGIKDGREAGELIEKARTRLDVGDKALAASVDLAEGIWSTVMALKEQEPRTRPTRLAHAHTMFQRSVETFATPAGHYHLALSFACAGPSRDLERAIANLQSAIEGAPEEIQFWHALGLLLSATEQWTAARGALEQGAEIGDLDLAAIGDGMGRRWESENVSGTPTSPGRQQQQQRRDSLRVKEFSMQHAITATNAPNTNGDAGGSADDEISKDKGGEGGDSEATTTGPIFLIDSDGTIAAGSTLLRPLLDHPRRSRHEVLEHALQLRMTQAAVAEHMDGPEQAADKWVEAFAWVAEQRERITLNGLGSTEDPKTPSEPAGAGALPDVETVHHHTHIVAHHIHGHMHMGTHQLHGHTSMTDLSSSPVDGAPPIHVIPASPNGYSQAGSPRSPSFEKLSPITERQPLSLLFEEQDKERGGAPSTGNGVGGGGGDTSKGKRMQQMLKNRVHKGQVRISTISRKIGHGVVRGSLRRSSSAPDFHSVLRVTNYQASSIHSRKRLSSLIYSNGSRTLTDSPPPPPPATPAPAQQMTKGNRRNARENRLLSDLWLMSAATFRRSGKIEQAKGSIQEAEVRDEGNPGVWVQLGLYYMALGGHEHHAIDAFHKALFIAPDDVPATVHLCRLYLSSAQKARVGQTRIVTNGLSVNGSGSGSDVGGNGNGWVGSREGADNVDLAAGLLEPLTRGAGWDVPEAWYFLGKAYGIQGRAERARECLGYALTLSEGRGVREIGDAVGWFL